VYNRQEPSVPRRKKSKPQKKERDFENHPLAALGKMNLALPEKTSSPQPTKEKPKKSEPDQDEDLFSSAMSGVRPIPKPKHDPPRAPSTPLPSFLHQEQEEVMQTLQDLVDGEVPLPLHETPEVMEGFAEGLDPRVLKKLRAGEFSVQDHLDLHGFTREEAKEKVDQFLLSSISSDNRCVLIIHGKGLGSKDHEPVLKNSLKSWLIRSGLRKWILAFTSARPCDGGAGAIYVLLKNRKKSRS
jgi:DNA-nicking Smr family endonuclease